MLVWQVQAVNYYGGVMELVDMSDSKSLAAMRGGSSPPTATPFDALVPPA